MLLDCGWAIGVLILLLELVTVFLPAGESRDWVYYYLAAGWAGGVILSARLPCESLVLPKMLLAAYGIVSLGYYFILPLLTVWMAWLWVLVLMVAYGWLKPLEQNRLLYGAGMMGFLLCAFSMCASLIYKSPWLELATDSNAVQYALSFVIFLLFTCPFVYAALNLKDVVAKTLPPALHTLLHVIALYVLVVLLFRVDRIETRFAVHHWRAYLEPAAMLRDGGWLLWDVPNVYGVLQTWLMAALPTDNTWQSLYLLNGTLLVLSGYMIFCAFFASYRTITGAAMALLIALSCTLMLFPTSGDPRMFPSTGALRFFWIYPLVGYVFFLCRSLAKTGRFPAYAASCGNLLWLTGVLWSPESALFVTIIWLPSLALMSVARSLHLPVSGIAERVGLSLLGPVAWLAAACAVIAGVYESRLGQWPDMALFSAYTRAFAFSYATVPIVHLGALPCWLFMFAMMVLACRQYASQAAVTAQAVMNVTVFYTVIAALWAVTSYYIPYSEDLHLTGTLPILVYLAGIALLHSKTVLPGMAKVAYEKAVVCLCSVLLLSSLIHMSPGVYVTANPLLPVHGNITEILEAPPAALQDLVKEARMPQGAHVMVLSQPFVQEDGNHVLKNMEGLYFKDLKIRSWLLPNSVLGYDRPLSPELYQMIAGRRAVRLADTEGWLIEWKTNPLRNYPWVQSTITTYYTQAAMFENSEYRIRKYEKRAAAQ